MLDTSSLILIVVIPVIVTMITLYMVRPGGPIEQFQDLENSYKWDPAKKQLVIDGDIVCNNLEVKAKGRFGPNNAVELGDHRKAGTGAVLLRNSNGQYSAVAGRLDNQNGINFEVTNNSESLEMTEGKLYAKSGVSLGPTKTNVTTGWGGILDIATRYGHTYIGSANGGWSHIYSDRPKFAFNKPITDVQSSPYKDYITYDSDITINNKGTSNHENYGRYMGFCGYGACSRVNVGLFKENEKARGKLRISRY